VCAHRSQSGGCRCELGLAVAVEPEVDVMQLCLLNRRKKAQRQQGCRHEPRPRGVQMAADTLGRPTYSRKQVSTPQLLVEVKWYRLRQQAANWPDHALVIFGAIKAENVGRLVLKM
jgi:hypothetical protein